MFPMFIAFFRKNNRNDSSRKSSQFLQMFIDKETIRQGGIYGVLFLLFVIAGIISPEFLTANNLTNVLRQSAALGIVSVGQTLVMITGGFDLSVTAVMQLVTVIIAEYTLGRNELILPAVLLTLFIGLIIGLLNGVIITKQHASPFMVTLAIAFVITGARLAYTRGTPSGLLPDGLRPLSQGEILGIPFSIVLYLSLTLIISIILQRTTFGRRLYATGANYKASRLTGVNVNTIKLSSYALSGLLAALAGLVLAAYVGYIDQWLGGGYDLDSVAAAAIGGVSLSGGKGGVWGTLAGVLLIRMLMNFVIVVGLSIEYQFVIRGLVVIAAVALYSFRSKD
jgi:ribose/xylose/arabinose/galactoside ABC-type transport system permease subunit